MQPFAGSRKGSHPAQRMLISESWKSRTHETRLGCIVSVQSPPPVPPKLTDKQREALNLLIQHKTSKEISRILGISPHTVDQRIESAKRKFGAATRGELAQAYMHSLPIGERLTYEDSHLSDLSINRETSTSDEPDRFEAMLDPNWTGQDEPWRPNRRYRVVPELFSGPGGTIYRLAAIVMMATLMVVTVLGGISIFVAMTEILTRSNG